MTKAAKTDKSPTRGWPPTRRAQQAARARCQKPWRYTTGPKTPEGKARSARNAIKHDLYGQTGQRLHRIFREQRRFRMRVARDLARKKKQRRQSRKETTATVRIDSFSGQYPTPWDVIARPQGPKQSRNRRAQCLWIASSLALLAMTDTRLLATVRIDFASAVGDNRVQPQNVVNFMTDHNRYARQTILPEIGPQGQAQLAAARVLVVGAGGLGCPALLYLAAAGVGTLGIIDFDRVDVSNLQRQVLFSGDDEGRSKSRAAAARLAALNPAITINAYDEELTDKNAPGLFSAYDLIIDGTDNFAAKFLINDAAVKLGKPVVYGAIQGFDGQVSVFDSARGPCYRCLHPYPPQSRIMNCAESGVIGALAGIIGTMQAMEAIKLVVGHESFAPLIGRLLIMDVRTMRPSTLTIPKHKDCPVCSRPADQIVLRYDAPVCAPAGVVEIECHQVAAEKDAFLIDVREQHEWDAGHIEGALHLPLSALQKDAGLFTPPKCAQRCVIYCQRGGRSKTAVEILTRAGHAGLYSLKGGYEAWRARQK